jgi:molybdenum cofactor biosynthesis protein B
MAAKVNAGGPGGTVSPGVEPSLIGDPVIPPRRALIVTVSDSVSRGLRDDASGDHLAERVVELGFEVERALVADEKAQISRLLAAAANRHDLILTTGGTGLTPRDVTPQATRAVLEYEIPGIPELMRYEGAHSTPYAYLSRAVAGVRCGCLIVNMPGSPNGARESLAALEPILDHALATIAGPFDHESASRVGTGAGRRKDRAG